MSCDDDCLTKANANYTYGKLKDVLLFAVEPLVTLKEQTHLKLSHDLPIQGLLQGRDGGPPCRFIKKPIKSTWIVSTSSLFG